MQRMANEIINQDRAPANPQTFIDKSNDLFGCQMVRKKSAIHEIKTVVWKRKCDRVANHGPHYGMSVVRSGGLQMRSSTVQQRDIQMDPAGRQPLRGQFRYIPGTSGYLQQRKRLDVELAGDIFDHRLRGRIPAKPAVDAPLISKGRVDF